MASSWLPLSGPVYKKTGSVARDHLASERTFLAWVRTCLGFVVLGPAIEQFSQLDIGELRPPPPPPPAAQRDRKQESCLVGALTGLGAGPMLYGAGRYVSNFRSLERGESRPAYRGAAVLTAGVASLAGSVYGAALRRRAATAARGDRWKGCSSIILFNFTVSQRPGYIRWSWLGKEM
ncbi:hypothetical protein DL766_007568 [Monosporascus sp. MC13-8B]|nr:hypothetical protein DL766_007568 [Monosporascus sp. MC13-8B]